MLTVGEAKGFCERGGIVNFFHENQRIRFQINAAVAAREEITISSQLLKLARIIKDAPDKEGA